MGVDNTGSDTRTETTDKPASQEQPYTPPPDNPGCPGQPSRLESRARSREDQERRAQETQNEDAGGAPREDREDEPTSEQGGETAEKAETSGERAAEAGEEREDEGRADTDQPGRRDERDPGNHDEGGKPGTPGDREQPRTQNTEQPTEPADRPASSEQRWTPSENPGSPGQYSRLESRALAREHQEAAAAQRNELGNDREPSTEQNTSTGPENGTDRPQAPAEPSEADLLGDRDQSPSREGEELSPQDESEPRPAERPEGQPSPEQNRRDQPVPGGASSADVPQSEAPDSDQPSPPDAQADPASEEPDQNIETADPAPETGTRRDEADDLPNNDEPLPSPEEQARPREATESLDQHGDRGRNAEDAETTDPGDENDEPDGGPHQSGATGGPGTELAPQEGSTTEVEEANRFAGRVRIAFDSDGQPIPPSRDSENETAGRGDLRRPEDDPADRDINESGRKRWETCEASKNAFDAAREVAKKMDELVLKPNPTGQAESRPPLAIDNFENHPHSPDITTSAFTLALFLGYAAKQIANTYQQRRTG